MTTFTQGRSQEGVPGLPIQSH